MRSKILSFLFLFVAVALMCSFFGCAHQQQYVINMHEGPVDRCRYAVQDHLDPLEEHGVTVLGCKAIDGRRWPPEWICITREIVPGADLPVLDIFDATNICRGLP